MTMPMTQHAVDNLCCLLLLIVLAVTDLMSFFTQLERSKVNHFSGSSLMSVSHGKR